MNTPYDLLHKTLLSDALGEAGRVETQVELVGEPLFGDVMFRSTRPLGEVERARLGLLGRMASRGACLFEPHSTNPRDGELRSALRKLWIVLEGDADDIGANEQPRLWGLSPGRPGALLRRFNCERARGWPAGVYRSTMEPRMAVVAIRELPRRRDTLLLRLMGRGTTLDQALDDLLALAPDDVVRRVALPGVLRWARHLREAHDDPRLRRQRDEHEQEDVMRATEWLDKYNEDQRGEGRREELLTLFELRLDRAMTDDERATVEARLRADGHEHVARAVLDHDADGLTRWLAERAG